MGLCMGLLGLDAPEDSAAGLEKLLLLLLALTLKAVSRNGPLVRVKLLCSSAAGSGSGTACSTGAGWVMVLAC